MTRVNLTLSAEEHALLLRLLEAARSDIRVEVHHSHFTPSFRDGLKHEESVLAELLEKVRQAAPQASS
ncbi:MAG: hypothetical protein WD847_16995 [Pirellulales bacterium]